MKYIIWTIVIWNFITFIMIGMDKYFAIRSKRRISEMTLIGCSFALGGIGVFAGMHTFRHKTRKARFIILVPISIVINAVAYVGIYTIFATK